MFRAILAYILRFHMKSAETSSKENGLRCFFMRCGIKFGLVLLMSSAACLGGEDSRSVWTNREGRKIDAEYMGYDPKSEVVSLKLKNGKKVSLKKGLLSEEDFAWIEQKEAQNAPGDPAALTEGRLGQVTSIPAGDGYPTSHVYYPSKLDLKTPPPVIFLFCPVGNGHSMASKFAKACEEHGWVAVGFEQFRNHKGELAEEQENMWKAILKNMKRLYFYDPERMYLGGMSGGSVSAFIRSEQTGEEARYWKGVVAICGWLGRMKSVNSPTKMAVMFVDNYEGAEEPKNSDFHKGEEKILKRRSSKVGYKWFKGGHELPPDEVLVPVLEWMGQNSVKTSEQQLPVESKLSGEKLKKDKD